MSMASGWTGGATGEQNLHSTMGSSLSAMVVIGFRGAHSSEKNIKERAAVAVESRLNHNAFSLRYDANHIIWSWVLKTPGVTTSYIHKLTIGGESLGLGVGPQTENA